MASSQKNTAMFHVVDDCLDIRNLLNMFIQYAGYESRVFDSAESYLDYFHSPKFIAPVAIISDYNMDGLSGLALIEQVREVLPEQQVIISSGLDSDVLSHTVLPTLCYILAKPYKSDELFSLLKRLVRHEQKRLEIKKERQKYTVKTEYHFYSDQDIKDKHGARYDTAQ